MIVHMRKQGCIFFFIKFLWENGIFYLWEWIFKQIIITFRHYFIFFFAIIYLLLLLLHDRNIFIINNMNQYYEK